MVNVDEMTEREFNKWSSNFVDWFRHEYPDLFEKYVKEWGEFGL